MQIDEDCIPYLASTATISILQGKDETLKKKLLNCIYGAAGIICSFVRNSSPKIPKRILEMCREDAFNEAVEKFRQNVLENKFEPVTKTCIGYIKTLFRRLYYQLYQQELKWKEDSWLQGAEAKSNSGNEDTRFEKKVSAVLALLSEEDQKMYQLYYVKGIKTREIAVMLGLEQQTVRSKLVKLRQRFREIWKTI